MNDPVRSSEGVGLDEVGNATRISGNEGMWRMQTLSRSAMKSGSPTTSRVPLKVAFP